MALLETIYLIHHSHTDIGFTHDQPVVWEIHRRFIDAAIDAAERDAANQADHAFKWQVETVAPLLQWLETAGSKQVERLVKLEKAGRIEISGLFLHMTPLANAAAHIEMLQTLRRLRKDFGFTITHAMSSDVNGHNWPLVDFLLDAGVESFSMAINEHFGGAPLRRPNLFRWQGPSGRAITALNGWHYSMANWSGIPESAEKLQASLPVLERKLKEANWPEGVPLVLQGTHRAGDNAGIEPLLSPFVKEWNEKVGMPRLKLATWRQYWAAVKSAAEKAPVVKGDWTDYWNFGCGSSARETGLNRASRSRLVTADQFLAIGAALGVGPGDNNPGGAGRNTEQVLATFAQHRALGWLAANVYDEHTWGAAESVGYPEGEDSISQWYHKAKTAYEARAYSQMIQRDAVAELSLLISRDKEDALVIFNPLPWERIVHGRFRGSILSKLDSPSDRRHYQDRGGTAGVIIHAAKVPGNGFRVLTHENLASVAEITIKTDEFEIENDFYRVKFDPKIGGIAGWYDKTLKREIADVTVPWKCGSIVYETPEIEGDAGRKSIFSTQFWDIERHGRYWQPEWKARRTSFTELVSHKVVRSALGIEVDQTVRVEGMPAPVRQRISFYPHSRAVEFESHWEMGLHSGPEATYMALPFAVRDAVARYDVGGVAVRAGEDQLPGCCRDYFTVQNWVDFSNEHWGVTVAMPDNPMVQLGDFHFGSNQREFKLERAMLLGWVTNNYWDVNFRGYQPGEVGARYMVLPHGGKFDETAAHKFGMEAAFPAVLQGLMEPPRHPARLRRVGSFLELPEPPILLLHQVPGWAAGRGSMKDKTLLLRFFNASNTVQTARIASAVLRIKCAEQADLFGVKTAALKVNAGVTEIAIEPRRIGVIRLAIE